MGDWDFLCDLEGEELADAMSAGGTSGDWEYIEEQKKKRKIGKLKEKNFKKEK